MGFFSNLFGKKASTQKQPDKKESAPQKMSTSSDYSGYSKAVIYCRKDFDIRTLRLPGFTGTAEVIRSGSVVNETEIIAAMLMKGCDKYNILVSPPNYGVGFIK